MPHVQGPNPLPRLLTVSAQQVLSRRELLLLWSAAGGAALLAACQPTPEPAPAPVPSPTAAGAPPRATAAAAPSAVTPPAAAAAPACVVVPAQTEGPYFVDLKLNRSDIRSDPTDGSVRPGTPLVLRFRVSEVSGNACTPLAGALVDVWQCDADGVYSGVRDGRFDTTGKQFLRGYQTTDAQGFAQFTTIYPGWYPGRAVHIHFKVRTNPAGPRGAEFTSQLYFDDELTDRVHAAQPYAARGAGRTRNSADGIYRNGGQQLTLDAQPQGQGYVALFDLGLRL